MSYLDAPRLHFRGTFRADPSTINNLPGNYEESSYATIEKSLDEYLELTEKFKDDPKRLREIQSQLGSVLSWNPMGTGNFQIVSATVESFVGSDGKLYDAGNSDDVLIGAGLETVDGPSGVPGKLVDLDTDLQVHTRLFGLVFSLTLEGQDAAALQGYFADTARLANLWFGRIPGGSNADADAGGCWQSILQETRWSPGVSASPFLEQLYQAAAAAAGLSVRITCFDYDPTLGSDTYTQGTILGTVGPHGEGEPRHFVAGRFLEPHQPERSQMWFAAARLSRAYKTLTVDLGNSIPGQVGADPALKVDYTPLDLGAMEAVLLVPDAEPLVLGAIDYSHDSYFRTAGVFQVDLSHLGDEQGSQLDRLPIGIRTTEKGKEPVLRLAESDDGLYVEVDQATRYMNPNDSETVEIYARRFGEPAPYEAFLELRPAQVRPSPYPIGFALPASTNAPGDAVSFPSTVAIGKSGKATFTVTANLLDVSEVAPRRQAIRSQLYFISGSWAPGNDWFAPLTLKVFFAGEPVAFPRWEDDVQPILAQYFYLYPVMAKTIGIDLDDYASVVENRAAIQQAMMLPFSDGLHMPVTRDVSRDDLAVVMRWLNTGFPQ